MDFLVFDKNNYLNKTYFLVKKHFRVIISSEMAAKSPFCIATPQLHVDLGQTGNHIQITRGFHKVSFLTFEPANSIGGDMKIVFKFSCLLCNLFTSISHKLFLSKYHYQSSWNYNTIIGRLMNGSCLLYSSGCCKNMHKCLFDFHQWNKRKKSLLLFFW